MFHRTHLKSLIIYSFIISSGSLSASSYCFFPKHIAPTWSLHGNCWRPLYCLDGCTIRLLGRDEFMLMVHWYGSKCFMWNGIFFPSGTFDIYKLNLLCYILFIWYCMFFSSAGDLWTMCRPKEGVAHCVLQSMDNEMGSEGCFYLNLLEWTTMWHYADPWQERFPDFLSFRKVKGQGQLQIVNHFLNKCLIHFSFATCVQCV